MNDVSAATTTLPAQRVASARAPSFAEAAERHLDDVYRYVLVLTRDPSLAEDLAAETFERALRMWRRFDPTRSSARTWLCTIARSTALDHFRAEKRRRNRERAVSEAEQQLEPPDLGLSPPLERALAAAQRRRPRGHSASRRARPRRGGGRANARDQLDRLHDTVQPCPETTRGVDER